MMDGSGVKCVKKPLVTQRYSHKRLLPVPSRLLEGECVRPAAWLSHQGPSSSPIPLIGLPSGSSICLILTYSISAKTLHIVFSCSMAFFVTIVGTLDPQGAALTTTGRKLLLRSRCKCMATFSG